MDEISIDLLRAAPCDKSRMVKIYHSPYLELHYFCLSPSAARFANVCSSPLASSMFAPGVPQVLQEFNSDNAILGSFVVSVYVLGYAFGPLFIAPLSELYGRRPIYHITNLLFIVFTVACAVASNFNMLIAFRFLEGVAGSAALTIGGGTVADLFAPEERGAALAVWQMGPMLGPIVGPTAGGFLSQAKGWRWIFWVIAITVSDGTKNPL